jgi:hypothetical protein
MLRERLTMYPPEARFTIYVWSLGGLTSIIAILRSVNMEITYDEAYTYLHYVQPGLFRSFFGETQLLNNHILFTLCAKVLVFITRMQYSEILLRTPSLISGAIYLYFAHKLSKSFRHYHLVFALFALNLYLNEFFSLARGYGMAAACVTVALYYFDRWQRDARDVFIFNLCMSWFCCASLANSIAFYVWCCTLPIMGMRILRADMLKSYVKNPFNKPFVAVAIFVCAFNIYVSRKGMSIFFFYFFYDSVIISIPYMLFATNVAACTFAICTATVFVFSLIKQRARNEYLNMLIIYVGICVTCAWTFHRGYPLQRTMLPVYPLFVLAVAKAIDWPEPRRWFKCAVTALIVVLCLQFVAKASINHTRAWAGNYRLRADVLRYIHLNTLGGESDEDFINFWAGFKSQHGDGNPVIPFYFLKLKYMSGRE